MVHPVLVNKALVTETHNLAWREYSLQNFRQARFILSKSGWINLQEAHPSFNDNTGAVLSSYRSCGYACATWKEWLLLHVSACLREFAVCFKCPFVTSVITCLLGGALTHIPDVQTTLIHQNPCYTSIKCSNMSQRLTGNLWWTSPAISYSCLIGTWDFEVGSKAANMHKCGKSVHNTYHTIWQRNTWGNVWKGSDCLWVILNEKVKPLFAGCFQ